MPALDHFHSLVRTCLQNDGWTITHDPYTMTFGQRGVFVDLGAERVLAAEKDDSKIAVEVKSFRGQPIAQPVLQDLQVPMVTFEPGKERIVQWIR